MNSEIYVLFFYTKLILVS